MSVDWTMISAVASTFYGIAFVGSVFLILVQLRRQSQEQFVSGTATMFEVWIDDDFQRAVQWVLYELSATSWRTFVGDHRGDYGERALVRVGGYFNRIGYLVAERLLGRNDRLLLDTVAGTAISVWQKIEPLVLEARLVENSTMFQDFQRMLPECYECYVPNQPLPPPLRENAARAEAATERPEV